MQNHNYNKRLKLIAYKLKKEMTKAEVCLWKYILRDSKTRYKFRKQRIIGKYIVDFVSLELKLIIEVDGESHNHMEIAKNDIIRQEYLEKLGYRIIRFTDEEILKELTSVGIIMEQEILEQENLLGLVKRL
jgi:very-short-patch-repair endonuclease